MEYNVSVHTALLTSANKEDMTCATIIPQVIEYLWSIQYKPPKTWQYKTGRKNLTYRSPNTD